MTLEMFTTSVLVGLIIEFRRLEDALLLDAVRLREPSEPIRLAAETMGASPASAGARCCG